MAKVSKTDESYDKHLMSCYDRQLFYSWNEHIKLVNATRNQVQKLDGFKI